MTEPELIQILKTAGDVKEEYEQDYERIIRLRSLMTKMTTSYSSNPGKGSFEDKLTAQYCALEELEAHCRERQEAYAEALKQAIDIIEIAETTAQRKVLKAKYIDCLKWDDIAKLANYSTMHCHRLHDRAIEFIAKKL